MSQDTFDPLAPFAAAAADLSAENAGRALADFVDRNPLPAVLAAAAAGAGLMALVALTARSDRPASPANAIPLAPTRAFDLDSLKQQIADLAERLGAALPAASSARQHVDATADAIGAGWDAVRQQALDTVGKLGRFEPQATAAIRAARDNPVWTAVIVGALGALLGSQWLGHSAEPQAGDAAAAPN